MSEQFRALFKELARPAAKEPTKKKRGSGDKTRGAFGVVARKIFRRVTVRLPAAAYQRATGFLAQTLDWFNLWHDDPAIDLQHYDDTGPQPPTPQGTQGYTSLHL